MEWPSILNSEDWRYKRKKNANPDYPFQTRNAAQIWPTTQLKQCRKETQRNLKLTEYEPASRVKKHHSETQKPCLLRPYKAN